MWALSPVSRLYSSLSLSLSLSPLLTDVVVMPTPICPVLFTMILRVLLFLPLLPLSVSHTFETPFYDRFYGRKIMVALLPPAGPGS